jgi:hypothetical protein
VLMRRTLRTDVALNVEKSNVALNVEKSMLQV